ncbi:hypothetical protein [Streptacidiphilus anmyonensis]|uniref:hypothetical protein n=1 Tax=Streptacidiphilus anmyonensis TaxID=405782 RepID=UPI000693B8BA|nr:hypothetical protein [Streptacidiphilus anmyonensis]
MARARAARSAGPVDPADARARSLLRRLRADPARMPEELAAFAVREMGPRAQARVDGLRSRLPEADAEHLRAETVAHGVRASVTEGAFVGGPFLVWIPVAFCRALLAQAQFVLELGALAGRDPRASARAAELLVLQGAYRDTRSAAAALAATPASTAAAPDPGGRSAGLWQVTMRMASVLGLRAVEGAGPTVRWWTRAGQWLLLTLVIVVGMVVPLVWLPYMTVSYQRSGRAIAARADAFYFGATAASPTETEAGTHARTAAQAEAEAEAGTDPGLVAACVRAVVSVVLVVGLVLLVLLTGVQLADRQWPLLVLVLGASSIGVGAWWQLSRRARDRRAEETP